MRVLVLCSGTGSIDRAFERRGWDVVSVDWLAKFRPTLCVDVNDWDYRTAYPNDYFQFVWASPACTQFSIARTTGGPRDIEGATALVRRCLEIAEYFGCEMVPGEPCHGSAQAPASDGGPALHRCDLLPVRLPLSKADQALAFVRLWGSLHAPAHLLHGDPVPCFCRKRCPPQVGSTWGRPCPRRGAQAERRLLAGAAVQHAPHAL